MKLGFVAITILSLITIVAQATHAQSPSKIARKPSCSEPARPPKMLTTLNLERAYPETVTSKDYEGRASILVYVSSGGYPTTVKIVLLPAWPRLQSNLTREVKQMRFEPARRVCANVEGVFLRTVTFRLAD
jgi:outer membrane biosynthesis protein TonB